VICIPILPLVDVAVAMLSIEVRATAAPAMIAMASRRVIRLAGPDIAFILKSMRIAARQHFVYHQTMIAGSQADLAVSNIAAAIGEPARARILCSLLDGRARTSTELAAIAGVTPSTTSVHLSRLREEGLIKALSQGKHRYYSLQSRQVARAIEALCVLTGSPRRAFAPTTPTHLRTARTCYDHIAGTLGVSLHDRLKALKWIVVRPGGPHTTYELSDNGARILEGLGIDIASARALRRRFAFGCLDWSERRFHIGGAFGAAFLEFALRQKWVLQEPGSRALAITSLGRRELQTQLGIMVNS